MNPFMEAIVRFGLVEPQAALRTLADCANHRMDYYWAVTPPSMTTKAVALFDLLIKETKARLMQLPDYLLPSHRCASTAQPALLRSRPGWGGPA